MDVGQLYLRSRRRAPEGTAGPQYSDSIVRDTIQILAAVGHPDRIAQLLITENARGIRNDSARCVLAEELKIITRFRRVLVGRNATKYPGGVVEHPVEIRAFLWRFDYGYYPQLEVTPAQLTKQDVVLM